VEVWRRMIVIKHPDDDPEKHRDIWHKLFRFFLSCSEAIAEKAKRSW
jgi:hypothetical protein